MSQFSWLLNGLLWCVVLKLSFLFPVHVLVSKKNKPKKKKKPKTKKTKPKQNKETNNLKYNICIFQAGPTINRVLGNCLRSKLPIPKF